MTAKPGGEVERAGRSAAALQALIDGFAEFGPPEPAIRSRLEKAREKAGEARQLLLEGRPLSHVWGAIGQGVIAVESVAHRMSDDAKERGGLPIVRLGG